MLTNDIISTNLVSPVREIGARVELYEGSTLLNSFSCEDRLIEFTVERVGEESKFFGFGIVQKMNMKLIDKDRELALSTANSLKVVYEIGGEEVSPYPSFNISEVNRDEETNQLSITAYDLLKSSSEKVVGDLVLTAPYTTIGFITAATVALNCVGWRTVWADVAETAFTTSFADGANFEGTESLREALNDVAEFTQTIYYIDNTDHLVFKRLTPDEGTLSINKDCYFELSSGEARRIGQICKVTELGDNVISKQVGGTSIQYVRDNVFYELLDNVGPLLDEGMDYLGTMGSITPFECKWRGNVLLEVADKITLEAKDGTYFTSYLLDDVVEYKGYLTETTKWKYSPDKAENANPSSLGEVLNQTYAKVDKVNKEISLVVKEQDGMREEINQIKVSTDGIQLSVKALEEEVENFAEIVIDEDAIVARVEASVGATMDEKDAAIKQEMTSLIEQTANSITSTITEKDNALKTELQSQISQSASSIVSTVNSVRDTANSAYNMADNAYDMADDASTLAEQTSRKFSWIVESGTSASSMTLTDDFLEIVADEVKIDATVKLADFMEVYEDDSYEDVGGYIGYGYGNNGSRNTYGIMMSNYDEDCYVIATDSGVRMTYNDSNAIYCSSKGVVMVTDDGKYEIVFDDNYGNLCPGEDDYQLLGEEDYRWQGLYADNPTIQTSDRREKYDIEYDMEKYEDFFNTLKPTQYKKTSGQSGRYHVGFVSQDIEDGLAEVGLTDLDFAGFVKSPLYKRDENRKKLIEEGIIDYRYALRYEEFIALNTHMIQKLMKRVDELEAEVAALKGEQ